MSSVCVEVEWRVFSLAIVNGGDEGRAAADTWSAPSLRTAIAVRAAARQCRRGRLLQGDQRRAPPARRARRRPCGDRGEPPRGRRRAGIAAAGARRSRRRGRRCSASTMRRSSEHKAFGVPTIVLDGGTGPQHVRPDHQRTIPDDERRSRICGSISPGWRAIPTSPRSSATVCRSTSRACACGSASASAASGKSRHSRPRDHHRASAGSRAQDLAQAR